MGRRLLLLFACAVACPGVVSAQPPAVAPAVDGVVALLERLDTLLQTGTGTEFPSLVAPTASSEEVEQFARDLFDSNTRRAVVAELDRVPLAGTRAGDGYRVVVELFMETADQARIVTALLDVRRTA